MPETLVAFRGSVRVERTAEFPGVTLTGETATGTPVSVTFNGPAPAGLPARLDDALVDLTGEKGEKRYRVSSAAGAWEISARAVHLHREIAAEFYRAIPPRPAPFIRRALWGLVLTLAASRAGLSFLRALRR